MAAAASAVTRSLEEWGWLGGKGSARCLLVEPDQLTALSWRLQGVADATAMDAGPPPVEPVVTLPLGRTLLRAALGERLDAHATRDGFAHVASCARALLVPFMDTMGAAVPVRMLDATSATERVVVAGLTLAGCDGIPLICPRSIRWGRASSSTGIPRPSERLRTQGPKPFMRSWLSLIASSPMLDRRT